jgi:hypothetical protein
MSASSTGPGGSDSLHDEQPDKMVRELTETLAGLKDLFSEWSTIQRRNNAVLQEVLNEIRAKLFTLQEDQLNKTRAELRASEEKQAVMRDELRNSRAERSSARILLELLWTLLQAKEVEVPVSIRARYRLLMENDPHDTKPASSDTTPSRGELDASHIFRVAREYQPRAKLPRLSLISPTVHHPIPILNPPLARINGEFTNTRLSQAITFKSSAATESLVSKEGAAGTKRGAFDGDLNSTKRLKTERDLDDLESHTPDHTVSDVNFKTEGESEKEHVRVKSEE